MQTPIIRYLPLILSVLFPASALGADDVPTSKDHPLFTRYPGSSIREYEKNYNAVEFAVGTGEDGNPKRQAVEGDMTLLRYFYDEKDQASPLQIMRNYQNAIKGIGGEVVYERPAKDNDGGEATRKVTTGERDVWVRLEQDIFSAPTQSYTLRIVEAKAMQQVIGANKMLEGINTKGFMTLYVNFDTGKWDLKADGQATVKEIVTMLQNAPTLNIGVEGHTDNVGTPASNKTLSVNRAKSVMNAIIAGGIAPARLTAAGFGQEKPIADIRTEEGRAKNRRVELVKKLCNRFSRLLKMKLKSPRPPFQRIPYKKRDRRWNP